MALTRQQIQGKTGTDVYRTVPCPDLDGDVRLKKLSAAGIVKFSQTAKADENGLVNLEGDDAVTAMALLVSMSIVDDDGQLQFDDHDGREYLASPAFPPVALVTLASECIDFNGINGKAAEAAKKN